jgi:hypothetical protein
MITLIMQGGPHAGEVYHEDNPPDAYYFPHSINYTIPEDIYDINGSFIMTRPEMTVDIYRRIYEMTALSRKSLYLLAQYVSEGLPLSNLAVYAFAGRT